MRRYFLATTIAVLVWCAVAVTLVVKVTRPSSPTRRTILEIVPESVESKRGLPPVIRGEGKVIIDTHGTAEDHKVLCRDKKVHPHYVLAALLGEGLIRGGEKVTFVCCYPGLKDPGEYRGVTFTFCSDDKDVVYATDKPTPGKIYRVSAD